MEVLEGLEDYIRCKIEREQWTHETLSQHLQQSYPGQKGLSLRSVERFCSAKGISKHPKVTEEELDAAVSDAVSKVSYAMCGNAPAPEPHGQHNDYIRMS